jgi:hypothetical protein
MATRLTGPVLQQTLVMQQLPVPPQQVTAASRRGGGHG